MLLIKLVMIFKRKIVSCLHFFELSEFFFEAFFVRVARTWTVFYWDSQNFTESWKIKSDKIDWTFQVSSVNSAQ